MGVFTPFKQKSKSWLEFIKRCNPMPEKKHRTKEQERSFDSGEQATGKMESGAENAPKLESLQVELSESQAKAQEYLDALQRERADFTNYRRRVELESAQIGRLASGTTIKKFLAAIDDLERALAHRPADDVWANGVELVYRKFQSILEAEGVMPMQAEGQPFDPNLHEAVMQEPSETHPSGSVIAVLQQGYMHGDRVLRPAMVKVAQ
jgi:molecular chaperone GrpE